MTPTRAKILQYMVLGEVIQRCCMVMAKNKTIGLVYTSQVFPYKRLNLALYHAEHCR